MENTDFNWKKDYAIKQMKTSKLAMFLYYTKICHFYHNGDLAAYVFNYWNPLAWIVATILIVIYVLMAGIPELIKYPEDIGLRVSPYFKENNIPIEWIKL